MSKIRVVVADDHPIVRLGICNALHKESDIEVVGEAANGSQAVQLVETLRPDVFVLDMQMPDMDGVAVARQVRTRCPEARILVLSAYAHDHYVFGMLSEGASGYLLKDDAVEHVVSAARAVAQGQTWLSPQVAGKVVRHATGRQPAPDLGPEQLTERETEVLRLLAQGRSNDEIADALCIAERTVRFHVSNLFEKLQVASRTEAAVKAIRLGLIET
jgi:NarL family two-component system response regulator LiaR